jgi:hypothetical protein
VNVPALAANDPALGRAIGVSILSSSPAANPGGFFDLDNVRVTAVPEPGCVALGGIAAGALMTRRRQRNTR